MELTLTPPVVTIAEASSTRSTVFTIESASIDPVADAIKQTLLSSEQIPAVTINLTDAGSTDQSKQSPAKTSASLV